MDAVPVEGWNEYTHFDHIDNPRPSKSWVTRLRRLANMACDDLRPDGGGWRANLPIMGMWMGLLVASHIHIRYVTGLNGLSGMAISMIKEAGRGQTYQNDDRSRQAEQTPSRWPLDHPTHRRPDPRRKGCRHSTHWRASATINGSTARVAEPT